MKSCNHLGIKNLKHLGSYGFMNYQGFMNGQGFMLYLIMLPWLVITGCSSPSGNSTGENNTSKIAIPVSIQALVLPGNTTAFTASLFLDEGTTPIASATIATDSPQKSVDFNDIVVPVGTHSFTIKFELQTETYDVILASAVSDPITISAGSSQSITFDILRYNYDYDLDGDLVTNFDEIHAGAPPNDDVCVIGVSLVGHCTV